MKKTKLMRAALLLLVLTLITSCFVGGTFAKYVTKGNSTDSARVAKWGVKVEANGTTFAKKYATDTANVTGTIAYSVISADADVSADADKVIAPGTKGDMVKMTITGTPEVAVKVSYTATFDVEGWNITDTNGTSKFYCPLQIKVDGTTIDGTGFDDKAAFKEAVEREISGSTNYGAGTDLTGVTAPSVSWAWPFEASTVTGVKNPQTDKNDTALGDAGSAKISLTITTTVTQID